MDKYAALKDLDDIFRSSVSVQEGENPFARLFLLGLHSFLQCLYYVLPTATSTVQSTGVSLFGSSPVQAASVAPPRGVTATPPSVGGGSTRAFDEAAGGVFGSGGELVFLFLPPISSDYLTSFCPVLLYSRF